MNENYESRKGIFFGIIGVLTLIVAIIGATLAYFTSRTGSEENAITVQSAQLIVTYTAGDSIIAGDLIPATNAVAKAGAARTGDNKCIDDNGYEVCAVYPFTIENTGNVAQNVIITIASGLNDFTNLRYIVNDVTTSESPVVVLDSAILPETGASKSLLGADLNTEVAIASSNTKAYELIIYLNETGESQDGEQGKRYAGTINVRVSGTNASGEVTGVID